MIVERKPNGDWVAQAEPEDTAPNQREDLLVLLIWAMEDCSLAGDEYCLSNWDMAVDLYDYYTGKLICLPYSRVEDLRQGKPITFYARDPEYNVGDWVEIGDCIPYEIIGQEGNIFTLRSEEGQIKTVTMEDVSPYID